MYFELNNSNISRYFFIVIILSFYYVKIIYETELQMNSIVCIQKSEYIKYLSYLYYSTIQYTVDYYCTFEYNTCTTVQHSNTVFKYLNNLIQEFI